MTSAPTWEELRDRAQGGTDDDWAFVDTHLCGRHFSVDALVWALRDGLYDENDNVRDFAATLLAKCEVPINETVLRELVGRAQRETNRYARFWLGCALAKRGMHDEATLAIWREACNDDSSAGAFARTISV